MRKLVSLLICVLFIIANNVFGNQKENYSESGIEFKLSDNILERRIPSDVKNTNKYLRMPFEHLGHPCAFAASISYAFTYEVNLLRGKASDNDKSQHPYIYGYHFYNKGSQNASTADFVQGYKLLMATGSLTNEDFGGFTLGYPTKWVSGYEKYYEAMKGRVVNYKYFDCTKSDGINGVKQWLFDHAGGTDTGGVLNFNVNSMGVQTKKIKSNPESGKTLITAFGGGNYNHSLTVVGYNDNIQCDLNRDGRSTDDVDINNDGIVDNLDRENGAFLIINSHIYWDNGFAWVPYSLFGKTSNQGGIGRNNQVYCITVDAEVEVKYTLKATISCKSRNNIKIYAGIAANENADKPEKIKGFAGAFNYAGGSFPMCGKNKSETIEIGLDVSDLIDSINGNTGSFFLCIDAKNGGSGIVKQLSLMDYTGDKEVEIKHNKENISFSKNIKIGGIQLPDSPILSSKKSYHKSQLHYSITPDFIKFSSKEADLKGSIIALYNVSGEKILSKRCNERLISISTVSLSSGFYRVVVSAQKNMDYNHVSSMNVFIVK